MTRIQRNKIVTDPQRLVVRYAVAADVSAAQGVLNHKEVIGWLGGFTMTGMLEPAAVTEKNGKVGMWVAEVDGKIVGVLLCAGRPAAFRAKYGSVGVLPEWRRMRISTALYCCMTLQGIIEGRRLWEDSIVGDNEAQLHALPTYGLQRVGELRHRTGSGKGLVLFDFSLMDADALPLMMSRAFSGPLLPKMKLLENYYSTEVMSANRAAYSKQQPEFLPKLEALQDAIRVHHHIEITRDRTHPTDLRRTPKTQLFTTQGS